MKIKYSSYQVLIFCLFIISGNIKFVLTHLDFPIDITLFFGLLVVIDIVYCLVFRKNEIKIDTFKLSFLIVLGLFYSLFYLSLTYTPSDGYAFKKTSFFILCIVAFVHPIFIKKFNLWIFVKTIAIISIPFSIYFIIAKSLFWSDYRYLIGEEFRPLLGAYGGLSLSLPFVVFYAAHRKNLAMIIVIQALMLALGSRGGFIFTLVILLYAFRRSIIIYLLKFKIRFKTAYLLALIPIIAFFIKFWNQIYSAIELGLYRFTSLLNFSQDNSSNERLEYYQFALDEISSSIGSFLFGHGIGSFDILFSGVDGRAQPHNIFLEALFELGLLGFILIFYLTVIPLFIKNRHLVLKMAYLYLFVNAMKSGGFDEMRYTFGVLGLLIFTNNKIVDNA